MQQCRPRNAKREGVMTSWQAGGWAWIIGDDGMIYTAQAEDIPEPQRGSGRVRFYVRQSDQWMYPMAYEVERVGPERTE
jgi:hypothetical protein